MLAEWLQKRLIQHGWPCEYERELAPVGELIEENQEHAEHVRQVVFLPMKNRPPFTEAFWDAFDTVLRVVAHEKGVRAYRQGRNLWLDGDYHVNKYGVIRRGLPPPPF